MVAYHMEIYGVIKIIGIIVGIENNKKFCCEIN